MANDITARLMNMKKEASDAAEEASELRGRISQIETTLKEEFGCKTVNEANRLLEKLKTEAEELEKEILTGLKEIKEVYDFA